MLISIVVPIYNVETYLVECIESIIHQTYRKIEVILVDDGSTDKSPQICDDYAKHDNRIVVIHKKNEGLVLARHDGAVAASGDYITFVDGDDFLLCERIESFVNGIVEYGYADMICGDLSYYPNTKNKISNALSEGLYDGEKLNQILQMFLSSHPFFTFGVTPNLVSKCIRKSFYILHERIPTEITLGEDLAVTYNLILNAKSIGVVKNSDYMYRYNEASITHRYDEKLADRISVLLEHMRSYAKANCDSIEKQITDYQCLLLKNVVLNDFLYYGANYKLSKKKLRGDLKLLNHKKVISSCRFSSLKDKILYWLIRNDNYAILYFLVRHRV